MKRSPLMFVAVAMAATPVVMMACGPSEPEAKAPTPAASVSAAPSPEPTVSAAPSPSPVVTAPPPPPAPPAVVEDMTASAEPTPAPTVKITAPADGVAIDAKKLADTVIKLDVKNWETKAGGAHVHLILDDQPYKRIDDPKVPIKLAELLPKDGTLAEGQHVLHAFPSRMTHESVKAKGASAMITFWVGKKGKAAVDYKKPHLVYSRPKGSYEGALAKEVLIDFYLMGTTLEKGDKVRYTITGPGLSSPLTGEFTKWAPKVAKNLGKGDFVFKLEYLDKDGKVVEGPLNTTSRTVKLDPDAATPDPHAGHAMPAASGSAAPAPSGSAKK